jgi:RNA polymerase sigma factor (sigma-70 family)
MIPALAQEAWNGLAELRPSLERFLLTRCRDPHQVDDVIQESLIRAARYRRGQQEPQRLKSWLLRISLNVLADELRRERRRRRLQTEPEELVDRPSAAAAVEELVEGESEVWVDGRWLSRVRVEAALQEGLGRLGEEERRLLLEYYDGGLDGRTLAARRALSPELVKVRLFRARARLRSSVGRALAAAAVRRAS